MSHHSVSGAGSSTESIATIADVPPPLLKHIVTLAKDGQLDHVLDAQPPHNDYEGMGDALVPSPPHLQQPLGQGTGFPSHNSGAPTVASHSSPSSRSSPAPVPAFTRSLTQDVRPPTFGTQSRAQLQITTSHSLLRAVRSDRPSPLSSVAATSPYMETASEIGSSAGLTGATTSDAASSIFMDDDSELGNADEWNTTVFVGGLSSFVTEDDLLNHFREFGDIHYVSSPSAF